MRKTPNGDATYYSLFTEILKFYLHAFDVELPKAYSHFSELSKVRNVIFTHVTHVCIYHKAGHFRTFSCTDRSFRSITVHIGSSGTWIPSFAQDRQLSCDPILWTLVVRANVGSLDLNISFELKHDISNVEFGFITQLGMIWQQTRANFCSFWCSIRTFSNIEHIGDIFHFTFVPFQMFDRLVATQPSKTLKFCWAEIFWSFAIASFLLVIIIGIWNSF